MTKKLEGLFGLKLGEYFITKISIIEKSFNHGNYHIEIDTPPSPNTLFMNYAVQCSKDMQSQYLNIFLPHLIKLKRDKKI